ncbi:TPA: RICIN domain-containing protein [Bacillus toyonensis]|uniref:RICIN domain-containing protein n=1 Tax=Bacillus toyonensis TaxID=155322 RepID=UPI0021CF3DE1|nr:RICIN domain-containing protein [Bacillus toyonensis]MCU5727294.1 RICIN domain-containing protein [Bacillus toyonensis]HDR7430870.1 RICIN domain-containing protein [Bacillus toyonensis]
MKSISKKVMAGLAVGAMSLSIWAPVSEAAPDNNRYYSIHLKADPRLAWDVAGNSGDNNRAILLWNGNRGDNEQFVFFKLDGQNYAIVNKNSGKPVTFGGASATYGNRKALLWDGPLLQRSWTGSPTEQWYLRDKGYNNYEIVNQGNQKVASYAYTWASEHVEFVDLDEANPSDSNKVFNIAKNPLEASGLPSPFPGFDYDTFSLPTLPAIGSRPKVPDYNNSGPIDQELPEKTESAVVGASLIPCIMVNDNQASDYTKIHNSPYYTLVKEEYWERIYSKVVPDGAPDKTTTKVGVTSTDQQKMTDTLSMKIGVDLGLKFGQQSASLKSEISRTLQTEISTSNTESKETTTDHVFISAPGKTTGFSKYQQVTKYTLKRADGSLVSDPWLVKNPDKTVTRKIEK